VLYLKVPSQHFPGRTEGTIKLPQSGISVYLKRFEVWTLEINHLPALRTACTGTNTSRNSMKNGTDRLLLREASGREFLCVELFVASESVFTRCTTNIKNKKLFTM
jgi:hypothetical protein